MGLFGLFQQPVAYTVNSLKAGHNTDEAQNFFKLIATTPGGGEFSAELGVLDDGHHKFVFVRSHKKGPLVAFALLRQNGPDAEVEQLFSTQRGRGYGHIALQTAEAVAKQQGASVLWLDSVPQAASFYVHEGYVTEDGTTFKKRL